MKIQIDDVKKENRGYFKKNIFVITNNKGNIYFTLDKAIIEITEPYLIKLEDIQEKSRIKKDINKFINEFRLYQFNKE